MSLELDGEAVRILAEFTLALVLFSGAAGVNLPALRHDAGVPARLLGIGLPLCVVLGVVAAQVLLPGLDVWEAAVVAAAVAPTDAALGEAVTADPSVPDRVRRSLSVESGLNDGLATPVVMFCIATAAGETANHANPAWQSVGRGHPGRGRGRGRARSGRSGCCCVSPTVGAGPWRSRAASSSCRWHC